jgi:RimJ/RimL family protein N-acetyltransferase
MPAGYGHIRHTAARGGMGLPKILRTERLELRPFSPSDSAAILDYSQDAAWKRFQQTSPSSLEEANVVLDELRLRDEEAEPCWAIVHSNRIVGIVSLVLDSERETAVVGYGIHEAYRGLGLTGEALRAVLEQAFSLYGALGRVTANSAEQNYSSHCLLKKLDFVHEADVRVRAREGIVDGTIYGLLRSDWYA